MNAVQQDVGGGGGGGGRGDKGRKGGKGSSSSSTTTHTSSSSSRSSGTTSTNVAVPLAASTKQHLPPQVFRKMTLCSTGFTEAANVSVWWACCGAAEGVCVYSRQRERAEGENIVYVVPKPCVPFFFSIP